MRVCRGVGFIVAVCGVVGCGDDIPDVASTDAAFGVTGDQPGPASSTADDTGGTSDPDPDPDPPQLDVDGFANGCFSISSDAGWLATSGDDGFAFSAAGSSDAAKFFMKASDLGTYLLYDEAGGYLVSESGPLLRQTSLTSDVLLVDDTYVSGAEWQLETSVADPTRYNLLNRRTSDALTLPGDAQPLPVAFEPATGCQEHPELSLDAEGQVERTTFDDGTLYGIVDTHSHILSNFAFGGGGIFHGAPFHRLGVEHALADCDTYHGTNGRKDFFGFAFDNEGADGVDLGSLLPNLLSGELEEDNHATAGYPEFTDWPNGPSRSTHQTQYYRWLERAHLAGLRLVIQHATTNSIICHLTAAQGIQPVRYSCDDMVAVDRIIDETYAMERYIDAQSGGPGQGFFRVVNTPQDARDVIAQGKMAVVLGIETSDLFDCSVVAREGKPTCDEAYVLEQVERYYDLGVRVMFPVHKYDNAFSAGDGDRAFIEVGNLFNSGHWSNFTQDCPTGVPTVFDSGDVAFGGLNVPRDEFISDPPNDFSTFPEAPLATALPFLSQIGEPPLKGDYCQNAGLTPLGETLFNEMIARGMIIEIDHLPRRSYERAFEILEANDYPAAGTHGTNYDGRLYALGGVSKTSLGRCREPGRPGATLDRLSERVALAEANGAYPAEGFGFDLNGFAGARGPRFGDGVCPTKQEDPITYPFESFGGDVTFTQPSIGNRELDFNTEGFVHIGMLPEMLQDARGDAVSDADLEPLFRSAEGYLRMWEKAEARAAALGGR